jgi:hypothetical protein
VHPATISFVGILSLSVSGSLHHERISEGFIDDTGIGTTNPYSKVITPMSHNELTHEEQTLQKKANNIIQFFLKLLHNIGGDLNIGKSASFITFHRWKGWKSSLLRKHESHPKTTLIHPYSGVSTIVPIKEREEPRRVLRWMMEIDGKSTAQHKLVFHKTRFFTTTIQGR